MSGTFAGQTLVKQTSDLVGKIPAATGDVNLLDVVYEITAGEGSSERCCTADTTSRRIRPGLTASSRRLVGR